MNLLVDIGNTRIKWALDSYHGIKPSIAISQHQPDFKEQVLQHWNKLPPPKILGISSVSAKEVSKQIIELAKTLWPEIKIIIAKAASQSFGVINAYQSVDSLGVDRWLGLIALKHFYPGNSCLVDCGTAITVDCLNDQGQHLGGMISPGIQLMKQSLIQGTERLSLIDKNYLVGLSDNTESAIYSGILYSAAGLIEKMQGQLNNNQILVLAGGDAELIAKYIKFEAILEPDFVIKGLSLYCKKENS